MPKEQYLSARDLAKRYDIGLSTVWRWAKEGRLPPPIKIGPGVTRWRLTRLEAHEAALSQSAE